MSERPQPVTRQSRHELRKTIIRLRLELQRQQLVHESQQVLRPLRQARNLGQSVRQQLRGNVPLWAGTGGAVLLALLAGRNRKWSRLLRLAIALTPLLLKLRAASDTEDTRSPPGTHL
ncbi:hypothetical protein D3C78_642980 [compost metagenome]